MSRYESFDTSRLRPRPLAERANKVTLADMRPLPAPGRREEVEGRRSPLENDAELIAFARTVRRAGEAGRKVIWMMGAHVVKVGCTPFVIDLAERGIVSCVATNGAGMIHDFELALIGATSEDVESNLAGGEFGMWEETGGHLHAAARLARERDMGYGEGVGCYIEEQGLPHREASLFWRLWRAGVPVTVHAAIGTEIIHQHPAMDGALVGGLSYRDFLIFVRQITELVPGSAVLNVGSAVILPEVFVKALAMARNAGAGAHGFAAAVFDMIDHYRPRVNVAERPTATGGRGYLFLGRHELLLPRLHELVTAEPAPEE